MTDSTRDLSDSHRSKSGKEPPFVRFDANDHKPSGYVRRPDYRQVVIKVSLSEHEGEIHAVLQFGEGTEWARRQFDEFITFRSVTLCPFDSLGPVVRALRSTGIEVIIETEAIRRAMYAGGW